MIGIMVLYIQLDEVCVEKVKKIVFGFMPITI